MLLSIVIPTHKRPAILRQCLEHIARQTVRDQLEVIVVSDGTGDSETRAVAESSWPMPVTFAEIPKSQQGAARNRGVELAKGERILFIGDDIFLKENACELHMNAKTKNAPTHALRASPSPATGEAWGGGAILGFTTWDPALKITPVMYWLEESGWQFGYGKIAHFAGKVLPKHSQHWFTYTSNLSLPKDVALAHPFRTDVTLYGWEDIAWGIGLAQGNVPLLYQPKAIAYHHHALTMEDSLKRMETIGESAAVIEKLEPNLHVAPRGLKRFLYTLISYLPTMRGRHLEAFLRGLTKTK